MKNKKIYLVVGGIALVAVVALAFSKSSGGLLQGRFGKKIMPMVEAPANNVRAETIPSGGAGGSAGTETGPFNVSTKDTSQIDALRNDLAVEPLNPPIVTNIATNPGAYAGNFIDTPFNTAVGEIRIYRNGTTEDATAGQSGVTIAKFKLAVNAQRDAALQSVGLYISGTIDINEIQNLKLFATGQTSPIATVATVTPEGIANFVLPTSFFIEKGGTKSFYVIADLNTGNENDTIKVFLNSETDLVTTNPYTKVINYDYDGLMCGSVGGNCSYTMLVPS